jgi:cell division protease FtsH
VERPRYLDLQGLGPSQAETSERTNARVDEAIARLVDEAFARATTILRACASTHEKTAKLLLEKETLGEADLAEIVAEVRTIAQTQDFTRHRTTAATKP